MTFVQAPSPEAIRAWNRFWISVNERSRYDQMAQIDEIEQGERVASLAHEEWFRIAARGETPDWWWTSQFT